MKHHVEKTIIPYRYVVEHRGEDLHAEHWKVEIPLLEAGCKAAREMFFEAVTEWLEKHGDKISDNHYLRLNPVKLYWCKAKTKWERTADLILKSEKCSPPEKYPDGKMLQKWAVRVEITWENEK